MKAERIKFRSSWEWDVAGLVDTILLLAEALAEVQNAHTAHEWLRYLVGCGLKPEEAFSTWEKVRRVHPKEIISTILSGEQADPLSPGLPPRTKLASLFGEGMKRGSSVRRDRSSTADTSSPDRPATADSLAGASPRSQSSMSTTTRSMHRQVVRTARPSLCDSGRRSGATSPSLRKFLDARSRGATPSLAWARNETSSPVPAQISPALTQ